MSITATSLKAQCDLHNRLFRNVTQGITDAEANMQYAGQINNIKWITGHMLHMRLNAFSRIAGLQPDESYAPHFGKGSQLTTTFVYPAIEELVSKWDAVSGIISEAIGNMPEAAFASKAPFNTPMINLDDTVLGAILFLYSHEALHIGQLSILRKLAGKEAMSYR